MKFCIKTHCNEFVTWSAMNKKKHTNGTTSELWL